MLFVVNQNHPQSASHGIQHRCSLCINTGTINVGFKFVSNQTFGTWYEREQVIRAKSSKRQFVLHLKFKRPLYTVMACSV